MIFGADVDEPLERAACSAVNSTDRRNACPIRGPIQSRSHEATRRGPHWHSARQAPSRDSEAPSPHQPRTDGRQRRDAGSYTCSPSPPAHPGRLPHALPTERSGRSHRPAAWSAMQYPAHGPATQEVLLVSRADDLSRVARRVDGLPLTQMASSGEICPCCKATTNCRNSHSQPWKKIAGLDSGLPFRSFGPPPELRRSSN